MFYQKYFKRIVDILLSMILIVLLSPIFVLTSLLVLIFHGTPVLFKQKRVGYNEEIFLMYKFRSMNNKKDSQGNLLPNNERITKFGKIIRKLSLDELPELFNILKGDMSFVGPRPLLVEYLPYYEERERKRHAVRPGLTGLSQVVGRNLMTWRERFEKDVEYVENISFINDLKIVWKTIFVVFSTKNVADAGKVKTDEFGDYLEYNGRKYRPLNKEREYEKYLAKEKTNE